MRSGIHGTFATLLLMVPVLSIPALAIFGIPQFAPVVASPLDEGHNKDRERRVGQSARPATDGLPDDLEDAPEFGQDDVATLPGKLGDSVPIPRHAPKEWDTERGAPAPYSNGDVPRRLPKRSDESANTDRQFWGAGSSASELDNFTVRNGLRNPDSQPFSGADRSADAAPLPSVPQRNPFQRAPIDGADASDIPESYHRPRDAGSDRGEVHQADDAAQAPLTWQNAVKQLNEFEIRNFRLERGHRENQFVFICSYTPSDSPRLSRRFEAEADEPLKAVEKVLEQIAEWQKRR